MSVKRGLNVMMSIPQKKRLARLGLDKCAICGKPVEVGERFTSSIKAIRHAECEPI